MFNCPGCKQTHKSPTRVTLAVRTVNHRAPFFNRKTKETRMVVVGRGTQIVKEEDLCSTCASMVVVVTTDSEPEEKIETTVEVDDSAVAAAAQYDFDNDEAGAL